MSLFFLKFNNNYSKIISEKNIKIGQRIRDLIFDKKNNQYILLLESEGGYFNKKKNILDGLYKNLDKNKLNLEGILSYNIKTKMPVKNINYNLIDIQKDSEFPEDFILVDNPKQYFSKDSSHPYQNLIKSIIQESTKSNDSKLFKIILASSKSS